MPLIANPWFSTAFHAPANKRVLMGHFSTPLTINTWF